MADEAQKTSAEQAEDSLQERLARRIKEAAAGNYKVSSWLAVEVGVFSYLIPLSHSSEIFPYTPIHQVPYTQPWFLGVANLRGELVGVTDIGVLMGQAPVQRTEQMLQQVKMLTFNPVLEINAALLVDRLIGLKRVDSFSRAQPRAEFSPPYLGTVYFDKMGKRWQELNLQVLAKTNEFLSIRQ